ncbi:plasma membrane ascorbate-dependent reductase CYBRD1 [Eucyclogobius newberryi]|uniref:plasma membrane ascorbate-dependent reductase CYBRD1 n=1 Tax=Eucyclogobius newberryi TaxID=166745 RepID=UPI003B5A4D48
MESFKLFLSALCAAALTGSLAIIFVLTWVLHYRDGLAWDGGSAEFNWHPVLMVVGLIFLQGTAIIIFRLPWTWACNKLVMKWIHASLHLLAFTLAVISTVAVFDFHNAAKIPNMYSLHSWLGIAAITLYCLQIVVGVVLYLIPITPVSWRAAFMPFHAFFGTVLFVGVIAVALMGITEKLIFGLKSPKYSESPPEAVFVNVLGVLLVAFGAIVVYTVTRVPWKRPNDQVFHSQHTNDKVGEDKDKVGPALTQQPDAPDAGTSDARRRVNKVDENF